MNNTKELDMYFDFNGAPLKSGSWKHWPIVHEKGWCGFVKNENYNDEPEVEVHWFGKENRTEPPRTNLINIKPIQITLYDGTYAYKCSNELIEWLHLNGRMFETSLRSEHFKIVNGVAYPANFKN